MLCAHLAASRGSGRLYCVPLPNSPLSTHSFVSYFEKASPQRVKNKENRHVLPHSRPSERRRPRTPVLLSQSCHKEGPREAGAGDTRPPTVRGPGWHPCVTASPSAGRSSPASLAVAVSFQPLPLPSLGLPLCLSTSVTESPSGRTRSSCVRARPNRLVSVWLPHLQIRSRSEGLGLQHAFIGGRGDTT